MCPTDRTVATEISSDFLQTFVEPWLTKLVLENQRQNGSLPLLLAFHGRFSR